MAHRGRRSGIPDCKPLEGLVLTPQVFSTSNLALGPVLHCSGNYSLSKNREKTITNFCVRNIMAKITKYAYFYQEPNIPKKLSCSSTPRPCLLLIPAIRESFL